MPRRSVLIGLQVRVEPLDRQLLRLLASFVVDAVVRDVWNGYQLFGTLGQLVRFDRMVAIIKQLLLFGDEEKHGAVRRFVRILDGGVVHEPFANRSALQFSHRHSSRLWIDDLASGSLG